MAVCRWPSGRRGWVKMIRAVIFDLDGTLVKTERLKGLSYAHAVQQLSPEPTPEEAVLRVFSEVVGRSREHVASTMVERFHLEDSAQALLVETLSQYPWQVLARIRLKIYDQMLADPDMLRSNQWPHTVELLKDFARQGYPLGLASMSICEQVNTVIRSVGLDGIFQVRLSREDVEEPKPNPEIYLLAARLHGKEPRECLVIEDSPAGVQAAVTAGMSCIAVATPLSKDGLHKQALLRPEWIVDEPERLKDTVERLLRSEVP